MPPLIKLENVSHSFGPDLLLDKVKFQIEAGERVCLIGRNGAGKSTLLKIIERLIIPQDGIVWHQNHLRVARLEQVLPTSSNLSVFEFVALGLASTGKLLSDYHRLINQLSDTSSPELIKQVEVLHSKLDAAQAWQFEQTIHTILSKLSLNPMQSIADLSGGWQRRVSLARALVTQPELLLLDEPTNHLDIEAIQWLEDFLLNANIAIIFITHDRALLQRIATRIIELDRGQLTSWPGDYQNFLRRKEEMLHAEEKHHANFDKKLAQEEQWIRQGIKARRTRNEGRVRALKALRLERSKRREVEGRATLHMTAAARSGQLVIEAKNISHQFNDTKIIDDFSINVMYGDRIGLIGPNGIGKSTLLNILLGKLTPKSGTVKLGTKLQVAYFDQKRSELDLDKTAAENVAQGSDYIEVNGHKKHIISYLNDFLFTPQRAMTPVRLLSGGECNRLLLARLFSHPTNFLVMDEPTNDLDIETLELLEELLSQYKGTILLVSHDRQFLDDIVTSTLVFEGKGKIQEFVGGYDDWLHQRGTISNQVSIPTTKIAAISRPSNQDKNELKRLTQQIEKLESQVNELHLIIAEPNFYQQDEKLIASTIEKVKNLNKKIEDAYSRWEELEG